MYKFRKKQDLKKLQQGNPQSEDESQQARIPSLPPELPASDFRTSLILPQLTKRFSVLRRGQAPSLTLQQTEEQTIVVNNAESISTKTTNTSYNPSPIQQSHIPTSSIRHEYEDSS